MLVGSWHVLAQCQIARLLCYPFAVLKCCYCKTVSLSPYKPRSSHCFIIVDKSTFILPAEILVKSIFILNTFSTVCQPWLCHNLH